MDYELTEEEIGDNLDLEIEATYPRSDGGVVSTVSVDKLLEAQLAKFHWYYASMDDEQVMVLISSFICNHCPAISTCGEDDLLCDADETLTQISAFFAARYESYVKLAADQSLPTQFATRDGKREKWLKEAGFRKVDPEGRKDGTVTRLMPAPRRG